MADKVGGFIAVYDGHLDVHENYVGFWVGRVGRVGCKEVIEGFFAVPDCVYGEA